MNTSTHHPNTGERTEYFAFISYNRRDFAWGKKLQRKLEGYRMPATPLAYDTLGMPCGEHEIMIVR